MPQYQKQSRNEAIFRKCLEGISYGAIGLEHGVSEARVEQIFKAEVKRLHPNLGVAGGPGFRVRVIEALKTQEPQP